MRIRENELERARRERGEEPRRRLRFPPLRLRRSRRTHGTPPPRLAGAH